MDQHWPLDLRFLHENKENVYLQECEDSRKSNEAITSY